MRDLSIEHVSNTNALEQNLELLVKQLRKLPNVHTILLFGSYAAGRRDLFTDLGLLVVMDSPLDFILVVQNW
jgi:predicted nucleotidyltransferase